MLRPGGLETLRIVMSNDLPATPAGSGNNVWLSAPATPARTSPAAAQATNHLSERRNCRSNDAPSFDISVSPRRLHYHPWYCTALWCHSRTLAQVAFLGQCPEITGRRTIATAGRASRRTRRLRLSF